MLVAAIAFDDERDAGLIDRHLIDRDLGLGDATKHFELGLHAALRRLDVAANDAHPRHAPRCGHAGYGTVMVDAFVDDRPAIGLQAL